MSKDESSVNTVINERLMWTMNHLRDLCVSAKAVQRPVMWMAMPVGADSRYSSDHCHISQRSTCRAQLGGQTSSEYIVKDEEAR